MYLPRVRENKGYTGLPSWVPNFSEKQTEAIPSIPLAFPIHKGTAPMDE